MATWSELIDTVAVGTKQHFLDFVTTIMGDAAEEVPAYADEAATYLTEWLRDNALADDATVKRNMMHVKIQIQNIAVKHAIKAHHATMLLLNKVLETALTALITTLRITLA